MPHEFQAFDEQVGELAHEFIRFLTHHKRRITAGEEVQKAVNQVGICHNYQTRIVV